MTGKTNKRAMTNIEMIIAMTIFIFSVVLVIYYISFIGLRQEPSEAFLDALEREFRDDAEVSYNVTYLKITAEISELCFNLPLHSDFPNDKTLMFIESGGNPVDFDIDGGLSVEKKDDNNYKIYSFPFEITTNQGDSPSGCADLTEGDYEYGVPISDKIFAENNFIELSDPLEFPYGSLKNHWNFQKDFAINVSNPKGNVFNVSGVKPPQVAVKARQFPIRFMDTEGAIIGANVNIQVW